MTVRRLRRLAMVGLSIGVAGYAAGVVAVFGAPQPAIPASVDAIVALGGDNERALRGYDLLRMGVAPELVVSHTEGRNPLRARGSAAMVLCHDPPEGVSCVAPDPDTTRGEARAIAELADAHGWERVVVVTAGFHARRAGLLVGQAAPALDVTVVKVAYNRTLARDAWYVIHETGGLLDAVLRPEPARRP